MQEEKFIDTQKMCRECGQAEDTVGAYRCRQKPENIELCISYLSRRDRRRHRKTLPMDRRVG